MTEQADRKKRYYNRPTKVKANVEGLFRAWKDWKEEEFVVGEYHSHYTTKYKGNDQDNWRIKVLECNFKIKLKDGTLVDPTGDILILNSAGQLNKFMSDVPIGDIVDITYGGKQKDKKDPTTEYHTFSRMESGDPNASSEGAVDEGL